MKYHKKKNNNNKKGSDLVLRCRARKKATGVEDRVTWETRAGKGMGGVTSREVKWGQPLTLDKNLC